MSDNITTLRDWSLIWLEDGKRCVSDQYDSASDVKWVIDVVAKIVRSQETLFQVKQLGKRQVVEATALGKEFYNCIKVDTAGIDRQFPNHRFSPLYGVFKQHVQALWDGSGRVRSYMVDSLNAAVEAIRATARDTSLKTSILNLQRCERGNAKRAKELLAAVRKDYSKVLVIRLDLEYLSEYGPGGRLRGQEITYEKVQEHRDEFLEHLRKGPFAEHLAGYLWKLEHGFTKGYHLHTAILLNGQRVCKDIVIADVLGEHWKNTITGGSGMFWSCNKVKETYPDCSIGMIARGDQPKWDSLGKTIRYMTKIDHLVRFQAPLKSKTFGCGGPYKRKV